MSSKQIVTKIISMVMVFAMMLSACATTVCAVAEADFDTGNDGIYDYVSIGASNTNGYGHEGYLPDDVNKDPLAASKADMNVYGYGRAPENAYPAQIAKALKTQLGVGEVNLHQLAISSMRVEELRVLLDNDYYGDEYTEWRFTGGQKWFEIALDGGIGSLRDAYQDSVKDAELITIDMGWNNFGVYAFNNIKTILADGNYWKAPDFSQLNGMDEDIKYDALKTIAFNYLKNNLDMTDEALVEKVDMIADTLAYAAMGSCYHFDVVMEKIYKLNPDAKVVVINIQNLADNLVVNFEGTELQLGDLYGELISMVDDYRRGKSPYADKFMFANAGDVSTFLDEIVAWDGNPGTLGEDMKDCFDMYDDSLYVRSIVEYLMAGQALSQLFGGFRDMAAGYGLEVFKNDAKYTYEFALTRTADDLLKLDLSKLDLKNPAGEDKDVEEYGKAVAQHLENLRNFEDGKHAYDYIFEDLLTNLRTQKTTVVVGRDQLAAQRADVVNQKANAETELEALKSQLAVATDPTTIATLNAYITEYEKGIAQADAGLAQIDAGLAQYDEGIAQLTQAIDVIVPMAKAEFEKKLEGVYNTYNNTLNHAYDIIATFVQYAAKINTIEINESSLNGFNSASASMMNIVVNDFINGAMNKFYYELYINGLSDTVVPEVSEYVVDECIFADPALCAIAVLAVRYELGNSFFAHPSTEGHDEVTDAVLVTLARDKTAKEDVNGDFLRPWSWLIEYAQKNYPATYEVIGQVAAYIGSEEFQILADRLEELYKEIDSATTPEEKARLADNTYELMVRLQAVAAKATDKKLDLDEIDYYISLGDSTINGYGIDGYIDSMQNGVNQVVAGSAHVLLAQKLFGENWKNRFGNFCQGSLRADDLLLFLGGDVELDDYYFAEIEPNLMEGTLEATQDKFIANVEKADLISVAIGGGNFLTFAGKYVNRVMGTTEGEPYELDWARIGIEADSATMKEIDDLLDILVSSVDALELMDEYLPEGVEIDDPAKLSRALVEGLIYGYISYHYYYYQVLERIREINPDAHIMVLGMFNPVDEWTLTTTVDGEEINVSVGDAVALLLESANVQLLAFALQDENCTYVDASEAETILEAEKPGEKLGFSDYYNSSFQSNGKAVHASKAGHEYIADQFYAAITTEYTKEELAKEAANAFYDYAKYLAEEFGDEGKEALKYAINNLAYFVNEYYDEAYAYAYDELYAAGYIHELDAKLGLAINEATALRGVVDGLEVDADLVEAKETLIREISLAEATLINIRELIHNDELTPETYELVMTLVNSLGDHAENIGTLAGQLGVVAVDRATVVINDVVAEAKLLAKELSAKAYAYIVEKAPVAYETLVETLVGAVKYYSHEAAKACYNWLVENPETVIEFFVEYGDDAVEFIVENHEIVLGVIGFVGVTYGDEMVELVLENADVILPAFASWFEIHGDIVWDLVAVYFFAVVEYYDLGVEIDFSSPEGIHSTLNNIIDVIGQLIGEIADGIYDYADSIGLIEKIENTLTELAISVKDKLVEMRPELEATAKEWVKNVAIFVYDKICDFVDNAVSGEFTPTEDSYYVSVNGGSAYYAELLAKKLAENLEVDSIKLGNTTWDNLDYEMLSKADLVTIGYDENELSAYAVSQLLGYIANFADTEVRESASEYVADVFVALEKELGDKINFNIADYEDDVLGYVTDTLDSILGTDIIAGNELDELDWAGLVGEENLSYVEEARAELKAQLAAAGIIETYTVELDVIAYIYENAEALGVTDFTDNVKESYVREVLGDSAIYTLEVPVADSIVFAAEAYLYSFVEFNVEYGKLILDLYEINPEATVILLGHYNAFDGVALELGDVKVELAEAYGLVSGVASVQPFVYALLSPNVAYVDISDAETIYDSYVNEGIVENNILNFLMLYLADNSITDASEAGNEYIYEQILGILEIGCEHVYSNDCDAECNKCGAIREVEGHVYSGECDVNCDKCGEVRVGAGHKFDSESCGAVCSVCGATRANGTHTIGNCEDGVCIVCGEKVGEGAHFFDGCEDTTCYKCDYVREAQAHAYDSCNDTECNVCGEVREAVAHKYSNACDAECNLCGEVREAGEHVYSGCEDASCNVCGEERNAGKHTLSDCADSVCDVCGQSVVAGTHKFGEWTVTKEATRKAAGERVRVCSECNYKEVQAIAALPGLSGGAIAGIVVGSIVVADAAGFAIYWFLIQKKSFAELLAIFSKPAAGAAAPEAPAAPEAEAAPETEEAPEAEEAPVEEETPAE